MREILDTTLIATKLGSSGKCSDRDSFLSVYCFILTKSRKKNYIKTNDNGQVSKGEINREKKFVF